MVIDTGWYSDWHLVMCWLLYGNMVNLPYGDIMIDIWWYVDWHLVILLFYLVICWMTSCDILIDIWWYVDWYLVICWLICDDMLIDIHMLLVALLHWAIHVSLSPLVICWYMMIDVLWYVDWLWLYSDWHQVIWWLTSDDTLISIGWNADWHVVIWWVTPEYWIKHDLVMDKCTRTIL